MVICNRALQERAPQSSIIESNPGWQIGLTAILVIPRSLRWPVPEPHYV
jgi:hypothetical protein